MVDVSLYSYEPNRGAAIAMANLFLVSGLWHLFQTIHFRSWRYTGLLPWAAVIYIAGFVVREVSVYNPTELGLFIPAQVLLYVAPPVYNAVNYFVLGRVLHYIPYLSPIHPGRVVSTFIGLDILIEVLTAQGASRLAQYDNANQVRIGLALIKAALLLLIALFVGFVALQVTFHRRCVRAGVLSPNLRALMIVLYISNSLILVRNVYRVVEVFLGTESAINTQECFFYVFDAATMYVNSLLLNYAFPAVFLPPDNRIYLGADGRTERDGPGWKDKRNFVLTILDPFDCVGLARGHDNRSRFWEHEDEHPVVQRDAAAAAACPGACSTARLFDPLWLGRLRARATLAAPALAPAGAGAGAIEPKMTPQSAV